MPDFLIGLARGLPMPREQLGQAVDGMIRNPTEHITEVSFGVVAVKLAAFNYGIHRCGANATRVRSSEQIILATKHKRPNGALGTIVRHLQMAIAGVSGQRNPTRECISDRMRQCA